MQKTIVQSATTLVFVAMALTRRRRETHSVWSVQQSSTCGCYADRHGYFIFFGS
jgi:hypothetical protein